MSYKLFGSCLSALCLCLGFGCGDSGGSNGNGGAGATSGGTAGANNGGAAGGIGGTAGALAAGSGTGGSSGQVPAGGDGGDDAAGSGGMSKGGSNSGGSDTGGVGSIVAPWDWTHIVGTGQSLAVGDHGTPVQSTTQPYNNLKLSTGTAAWPVDPAASGLTMVPLIEPVGRAAPSYPSSWPTNISGETAHSAMGNQITALVQQAADRDYITVHGEFGENGQCMTFLRKGATPSGVNGRAFQATLIETQAVKRLATLAGKTYGVGAIIITHGECDAGNTSYESDLVRLWTDYNTDLKAITGQTQSIPMLVSQQNSVNNRSASTLAQWKVGVNHPGDIVCIGPKYQYPYATDGIHMISDGYRQLGEKYGQVYFERVVLGNAWQPLQPTTVERAGRVITVHFHVPVPPLVWDTTLQAPHQSVAAWQAGKGFEVRSGSTNIAISDVAISGDAVQITCATDLPPTGVMVGYALVGEATARTTPVAGTFRWGQLRDSDPFTGSITHRAQPNFAVAFELPVP